MDRCTSYEASGLEYILPSPVVLNKLCLSHDRTELFIVSVIRLAIWLVLYFVINDLVDLNAHPFIYYTLITMFGLNILYVGLVVSKIPAIQV